MQAHILSLHTPQSVGFRPPTPRLWGSKGQNSTFLEHRHVAYQIKGNHKCNNMVANILPQTPPTPNPWDRTKGQNSTFQNMVMLHTK